MEGQPTRELWGWLRAQGIISPVEALDLVSPLVLLKRRMPRRMWTRLLAADVADVHDYLASGVLERELVGAYGAAAEQWNGIRSLYRGLVNPIGLLNLVDAAWSVERDAYGAVYDELLDRAAADSAEGLVRHPPELVDALVAALAPMPGDLVIDPVAGIGSLVLAAARRSSATVRGFEPDEVLVRIGTAALLLHDVRDASIQLLDALRRDIQIPPAEVVLCCPPFGGQLDTSELVGDWLGLRTARSELLQLEVATRSIGRGGRAGVIVPQSILFATTAAHVELRRRLIEERGLVAVVSLPARLFSTVALPAAVLLLADGSPPDEIWLTEVDEPVDVAPALLAAGRLVTGGSVSLDSTWLGIPRVGLRERRYELLPSAGGLGAGASTGPTFDEMLAQVIEQERELLAELTAMGRGLDSR